MLSPGGAAATVATTLAAGLGLRWTLHAIRTRGTPPPTKLSAQVSGLPAKKGTPVLVMLSGFCDDHGSFAQVVPRFQDSHTVVTMVMPDYDTKALSKFWGYNAHEMVHMFRNTLDATVPEGDKATLVAHDWGAAIAQWYLLSEGSQRVDRMVLMDVGNKIPENLGNLSAVLPYQLWLSFCFLLERCTLPLLGDIMAFLLFPWKAIGPCPQETSMPKRTSGFPPASRMAYPYLRTYLSRALGTLPRMSDRNSELPLPVPTTYVFGKNKRATFHTQAFLDRLEKTPGYSWVGMDCGHFIQAQKPDELEQIIRQRIAL